MYHMYKQQQVDTVMVDVCMCLWVWTEREWGFTMREEK